MAGAVAAARREAASAFGNGTVFLERYVQAPRHIEVQIFGDQAGQVVHLFERECSIQRRYQKIIEEAPAPALPERLRAELCAAAVAAGQAIGYVGAGTVEFVLDAAGQFYFLEVNTRLQVEHPVTELITGLDLVRLQLEVAAGRPLPPGLGTSRAGHAIEARLYAEDAAAGYLPASGELHTFEIDPAPGLRVDAGFASGTTVSTFYDSMLAKVIGYGPTRDDARRVLAGALARARLHGVITNRDLLVGILREPEFRAGTVDTGYLAGTGLASWPATARPRRPTCWPRRWPARPHRRLTTPGAGHPAVGLAQQPERGPAGRRYETRRPHRRGAGTRFGRDGRSVRAQVDGEPLPGVVLHAATPERVDLETGGVRRVIAVRRVGLVSYVDSALGHSALAEAERFPDPAGRRAGRLAAGPDARHGRPGRGQRGRPRFGRDGDPGRSRP